MFGFILYCFTLAAATIVVAWALTERHVHKHNAEVRLQEINRLRSGYMHLIGTSASKGSYHYVSLDSGQHWYNTEPSGDGHKIVGKADPKHIEEIFGWEDLGNYVIKNGPIDLSDPVCVDKLSAAGIKVVSE